MWAELFHLPLAGPLPLCLFLPLSPSLPASSPLTSAHVAVTCFLNKTPPDYKVRWHWNHTVCMGAWCPAATQMLRVCRPTAQNLTLEIKA